MLRRSGGPSQRVPLVVWATTALHVGLLLAFAFLYPPFTGFDETQHVDAVLSIRHGDGWPAPQERELSEGIVAVATPVLQAASQLPFSDDELLPRDERPSVAELGVERDSVGQLLPNQITQHPPLYYALQAGVLAVLPGSADWAYDKTVGSCASSASCSWRRCRCSPGPPPGRCGPRPWSGRSPPCCRVGAAAAARRVERQQRRCVRARLRVRPAAARPVAGGDVRRRTVVLTGVGVGVAMLTKGFALVLPLPVALAFLVGARRGGARPASWTAGLLPAFLSLTVAFAVGGWWWLRNLLLYGRVQPSGWPASYRDVLRLEPRGPDEPARLTDFVAGSYSRLSERFWGGLEINYVGPDTFPHWWTDTLAAATAIALLAAVVAARRDRLPLTVAVLVPFACTLGVIVYGIWTGFTYSPDFPGAQGRYLFGNLPSLAAAVALGLVALTRRASRAVPVGAALLAVGMQVAGLYSVLSRSWLPVYDGRGRAARYGDALDGILDYAPWPSAVPLTAFALTGLAVVAVLVLAVRLAVVGERQPAAVA
jgi:hypothetical protein